MRTTKNAIMVNIPFMKYIFVFFLLSVNKSQRLFINGVEPSLVSLNNAIYGNTPAVYFKNKIYKLKISKFMQ